MALRTLRMKVDPLHPDPASIERAAAVLRDGGLVGFPTETVYGLGADALSEDAVRRLFGAKGRPGDNPLIVHVSDPGMVPRVARSVPPLAQRLMDAFWPGPLTFVLPRDPAIPETVTGGLDTVGVRMPKNPVAHALIAAAGRPIAAPSANRSGAPSPTTADHVLTDLDGRIDLLLDAGPCTVGVESTVVQMTEDEGLTILRLGAVTPEALAAHAKVAVHPHARGVRATEDEAVASPGMKHRHYAPATMLRLYEGPDRVETLRTARERALARGEHVAAIVTEESGIEGPGVVRIASRSQPEAYARNLYATMRALDDQGYAFILIEGIDAEGIGAAVMDRLRRAATG